MGHGRVSGDHQVQILHDRSSVHERTARLVEAAGKIGDRDRSFPDLLTARAFLKAEKLDAVQSGERSKLGQRNGAQTVPGMPGRLNS
jgi:hypothetical protein